MDTDTATQSSTSQQHAYSPEGSLVAQGPTKRRKKDDHERTRVSRACDRCKRKKSRCTGRHPCALCTRAGLTCEFNAVYTRGRLPPILSEHDDIRPAENNILSLGSGDSDTRKSEDKEAVEDMGDIEQQSGARQLLHLTASRADTRVLSSRNSPEPTQTDRQGHYVGPSSGVSFLLRVQKKLHQKVSFTPNSSIFTFGDAPLPPFDHSFFVLPPKSNAQELVARYFDFAVPTHRFLHRPTVELWLEEFYENMGVMRQKEGARERTALLLMVFAQGKAYSDPADSKANVDTSARYFQAAEHQLSAETGEIRLTSVQARLCQCFYLLSQSRINHAWSLFGTTTHLILAIGIHRKRRVETMHGVDLIDLECRKRVFWCAYSLDNYLSAALGRPRTFHDDDIDQELPSLVNDSDITHHKIIPNPSKAQSIMMAPIAHCMLSKIVSHILHDLYALRPPSSANRVILAGRYTKDLLEWRKSLSRFLDAENVDTSLLLPLFQRQRNVLNLGYYHALILIHRPFILNNFASLNGRSKRAGSVNKDKNVAECLNAAMNVATIVNELAEGQQMFKAFWFTQYFAFCAVVVLYIYTIQQRNAPEETYLRYLNAASKCQSQISAVAVKESLAQRYTVVLEELRLEAIKQTQTQKQQHDLRAPDHESTAATSTSWQYVAPPVQESGEIDMDEFGTSELDAAFEAANAELSGNIATPSSLMAELTSWGEFDSFVTAGMGGLDFMFMGDTDRSWELDLTHDTTNIGATEEESLSPVKFMS
ncbi:fungal specific transcription factor domain-containing protein [Phlyctema vagabunda]|uniref:Fungal specific transcription factor domain-containing protein n=1 Tax=Phlyctema vagabunda TaxID=108571 RepID=A0ABR4PPL7_9HELO